MYFNFLVILKFSFLISVRKNCNCFMSPNYRKILIIQSTTRIIIELYYVAIISRFRSFHPYLKKYFYHILNE